MPSPKMWLAAFSLAGILLWVTDRCLLESIEVISSSMEPTFLPDERVYLQRVGCGKIQRFDVVVLDRQVVGGRIVKRVIGLPGDRVKLEDSWRVTVNGKTLDYQVVSGTTNRLVEAGVHQIQLQRNPKINIKTRYGTNDFQLGEDEYYVLGDNRLASGDSRLFGVIKRGEIMGKLRLIWYSYDLSSGYIRWHRPGTIVR